MLPQKLREVVTCAFKIECELNSMARQRGALLAAPTQESLLLASVEKLYASLRRILDSLKLYKKRKGIHSQLQQMLEKQRNGFQKHQADMKSQTQEISDFLQKTDQEIQREEARLRATQAQIHAREQELEELTTQLKSLNLRKINEELKQRLLKCREYLEALDLQQFMHTFMAIVMPE
jgi:hypothetical protein